MHRHNRKYGYGDILKTYCGVDPSWPILGEVQHSLFVSSHFFTSDGHIGPRRPTGRRGLLLFSWQYLLPFPHQWAIGDPLVYEEDLWARANQAGVDTLLSALDGPVLVMPKMNQELGPNRRLSDYTKLISRARSLAEGRAIHVSLHPLDWQLGERLVESLGISLAPPPQDGASPQALAVDSVMRMSAASLVVSDYFGAHVFRASAFFKRPVWVDPSAMHDAIHPWISTIFAQFLQLEADNPARVTLSERVLGFEHRRTREELRNRLFMPHVPLPARRTLVAGYKTLRRVGVRIRESKFLGKSSPWQSWTRKVRMPLWRKQLEREYASYGKT